MIEEKQYSHSCPQQTRLTRLNTSISEYRNMIMAGKEYD